jgi:pimeloyl-ACP methyl ester carboxylesterase
LAYVEQGSGKPVVLVHGAVADLRNWELVREALVRNYRVIAYTQRYHGTAPWPDEGKSFSIATHADDLAKFISSLDAGPVHLVGWSYGGSVAAVAAANNPQLVQSLVLYEPNLTAVLAPESPEAKQAAEEGARMFGPAANTSKAGDNVQAAFRLVEGALQLQPGEAARQPEQWQAMWRDNARTVPLLFSAPRPAISCDTLKGFTKPTLVLVGEGTRSFFPIIAERVRECIPGAERAVLPGVNHDGPIRDPAGFSAAVGAFISRH